jgi:hypothetical protein
VTTHPPLLALGFSSPLILLWLAAAAVPLLLHLWRRRRYRETPWAAMEYLLAAIRSRRRRMRIEQLILLAVRTLLVILLVLALAELYVTSDTFLPPSRQRVHKLLVIDGSYSMTYAPGEQSLFDRAKALAIRLVEDGSRQGDAFSLVMMSSPPVPVVRTPTFGQDDFVDDNPQAISARRSKSSKTSSARPTPSSPKSSGTRSISSPISGAYRGHRARKRKGCSASD